MNDQTEFETKLKRARAGKSQYLRIQAWHLQQTKEPELLRAALSLLSRMISEYPDAIDLAPAYTQRAECLEALGCMDDALAAYQLSLCRQRAFPSARDDAYLGYGELVLALRRRDLYEEALTVVNEFGNSQLFPIQQYRSAAIRCLIAANRGDRPQAREWARAALSAAARTESGLRYHKNLGLVASDRPDLRERLEELSL